MNRLVKSIIKDDVCVRDNVKNKIIKLHNKKESETSLSFIFIRIFI
jgi:hypothetical protein